MNNLEKYNKVFMDNLLVEENQLKGLLYQGVAEWDSIGHMNLIAELEDAFDISMETDDVIDFSGYEKGMELLGKYGIEV